MDWFLFADTVVELRFKYDLQCLFFRHETSSLNKYFVVNQHKFEFVPYFEAVHAPNVIPDQSLRNLHVFSAICWSPVNRTGKVKQKNKTAYRCWIIWLHPQARNIYGIIVSSQNLTVMQGYPLSKGLCSLRQHSVFAAAGETWPVNTRGLRRFLLFLHFEKHSKRFFLYGLLRRRRDFSLFGRAKLGDWLTYITTESSPQLLRSRQKARSTAANP